MILPSSPASRSNESEPDFPEFCCGDSTQIKPSGSGAQPAETIPPVDAFVYILRCADGSLYTGWTNCLRRRLAAHNAGTASRCTRSRRPVILLYWEACADRSQALRREAAIKRLSRADKLRLIASVNPLLESFPFPEETN